MLFPGTVTRILSKRNGEENQTNGHISSFSNTKKESHNTFVLGYHKYIKNASLASLYIGTLQENFKKLKLKIQKEIYESIKIDS